MFATDPALGDRGSSLVNGDPARTVGPFEGIRQVAGEARTVTSGSTAEDAAAADTVVVVVGYTPGDEGEEYYISSGGDRASLDLPTGHNELVSSVLDLGKPTVVIVESGSIVNLPWLAHANQNQATIWAGYPGVRGGIALGRLLFGEANFSGKMPMAWPDELELPEFKGSTNTPMDYFFGYREFDRRRYVEGTAASLLFPFGHGLSYSSFEYGNLAVPCAAVAETAVFNVTVDVTNTSSVDGYEVVMLFVKPPTPPEGITGSRPHKELKSFARVAVAAGETVTAELPVRVRDLRRWEGGEDGTWVTDPGEYTILVGKDAADAEAGGVSGAFTISEE
jgi:beta-glucosidase